MGKPFDNQSIRKLAVCVLLAAFVLSPFTSIAASGDDLPKDLDRTIHETTSVTEMPLQGERAVVGSYVLSLEDCIKMALARNRRLIAAGYDIEAAKNQLMESKATFWPVMEYKYRAAPVPNDASDALNKFFEGELTFFNSIHLGIGFPMASFGQLKEAQHLAAGGVEAAKLKEEGLRYETAFQVKKIYNGILLAKETIRILDDAIIKLRDKIAEEDAKEDKTMDPYDILQMKVFLGELEKRMDEAHHNLKLAYEGLKVTLDLESSADVEIKEDHLAPRIHDLEAEEKFVKAATEEHPDTKLVSVGVDIKRRQYRLEKLKLLPRGGLGFFLDVGRTSNEVAGVKTTDDFNNPFNYSRAGIGFEFSGNIDFHGSAARIRKAKAEYMKATYEALIAKRGLGLKVKEAYSNVKRMREDLGRAKHMESMAQQMVFLSKMNIDSGIGDDQKYADALKLLLVSRGQFFRSVFDFNMALAELEKQVGAERYSQLSSESGETLDDLLEQRSDSQQKFYDQDHVDMEGIHNEENP